MLLGSLIRFPHDIPVPVPVHPSMGDMSTADKLLCPHFQLSAQLGSLGSRLVGMIQYVLPLDHVVGLAKDVGPPHLAGEEVGVDKAVADHAVRAAQPQQANDGQEDTQTNVDQRSHPAGRGGGYGSEGTDHGEPIWGGVDDESMPGQSWGVFPP